jgi:transposase
VARRLGATRTAALYWHRAWKKDKKNGLMSKGQPGFASKLSEKKRKVFKEAILKGPLSHGFPTNLWTLKRLGVVMKKTTGISFSSVWTWHIVRALGFTPQKPQVRSAKRDERAIAEWKAKRLPGLKKMGDNAWIFSGLRG